MCMYLMNSGLEFLVQDLQSKYLPSANEVWGQGNAFTPVCLFAGRGSAPRGSASKGGLHPEEVFIQGSLYLRGFCIKGGLHPRGACIQGDLHSLGLGSPPPNKVCINGGWVDPPPPQGYCGKQSTSGWYASYWNAVLLFGLTDVFH